MTRLSMLVVVAITITGAAILFWQFWPNSRSQRLSASGNPGPWTLEQTRAFPDYSVLWLGKEFNGLPLTEITRDVGDDNPASPSPASRDAFVFTYGTCKIQPGNDACAIPLTLIVEPRCYLPPELLSADQKTGAVRTVRGAAEQQDFMGGRVIWTADVAISILGSADPEQAVQALRPIAETGAPVSSLAAPDKAECAKIRGRDRSKVIAAMTPASLPDAITSSGSILVGAPSLVGGTVRVPVSTDGSGFAPYSGFSVHLRWSNSVFTYASVDNTGTVIPSPFCPNPIVDGDGGGVTYACTSTSGSVTTAGLLATIVLTPAASGCSPLHLFTFGAPDGGVAGNGTYTVDADTNAPQTTAYVDGSANVAGQVC